MRLIKRVRSGQPDVDQGKVGGFPITYNPDDRRFYLHERGSEDGCDVLVTSTSFRHIVSIAEDMDRMVMARGKRKPARGTA